MTRIVLLGGRLCLYACQNAAADDFQPKVCAAAVEYVGKALHPAVVPTALAELGQPLAGDLDPVLVGSLNDSVDWILKNTKAPGLTVAVGLPGRGIWSTSKGLALTEPPTPLADVPYFHWASVGKTFTAALVMQLVEEGKLAYDAPLARWFPKFPNAQAITVDHLLTHTNGIFSFNADLKFRKASAYHAPTD